MRQPSDDERIASDTVDDVAKKAPAQARGRSQGGGGGRRVTPAVDPSEEEEEAIVEKVLSNGDLYTGELAGSAPHGRGKYLWADGRMYEGNWLRGKPSGKGKFSWPSGATYEGEFRSGRMDGVGTFTGADGDTYHGQWAADRKQGFGSKFYANGDYYEGTWRRNLQEGHGRYLWRNGNQYVGEWCGGVIHGRGILIRANGNRCVGQWENGAQKGNGGFTCPDGSYYIDSWSSGDPNALDGGHYRALDGGHYRTGIASRKETPAGRRSFSPFFQPENRSAPATPMPHSSTKGWSIDGSQRPQQQGRLAAEKKYPGICMWDRNSEAGDITCDVIDSLESPTLYRDESSNDSGSLVGTMKQLQSSSAWSTAEAKKPGQTISKGHKNYDLMLNLQLGISYAIGKPCSAQLRELKQADFDPMQKSWTRFPPEGTKTTPPHQSPEFRWKDYCPMVFSSLRRLFSVDPADYMLAICGNDALRELSSPGKSGSFFFLTQDDRFMMKTVKNSELKVLVRMLPSYFRHVCQHEKSLATRFYGVHCVKPLGGQKVRFVVMGNVFCSEYQIHRRFDLKGSSHGRTTEKNEEEIDETTTLKDLDLDFVFRLQNSCCSELLEQIKKDCEFLESEGIMDYSLLVGVHFLSPNRASPVSYKKESFRREPCSELRFSASNC